MHAYIIADLQWNVLGSICALLLYLHLVSSCREHDWKITRVTDNSKEQEQFLRWNKSQTELFPSSRACLWQGTGTERRGSAPRQEWQQVYHDQKKEQQRRQMLCLESCSEHPGFRKYHVNLSNVHFLYQNNICHCTPLFHSVGMTKEGSVWMSS